MQKKPSLESLFHSPPAVYRPIPQWSWNGDLTRERIQEQLTQFAAQGCGGLFTHARPGHITGYMSDTYLDLWRFALEEAARLGMAFHIYDEFMCPAGHAGGLVTAERPHLAIQELTLVPWAGLERYPPGAFSTWRAPDAVSGAPSRLTDEDARAATPRNPAWALAIRAQTASAGFGDHPFPDLLLRETFDAFIESTHDRYATWAGEHFHTDFNPAPGAPDSGVRFMFCDEPELVSRGGLPLSHDLLKAFRDDHGYDLTDHLPALAFGSALPLPSSFSVAGDTDEVPVPGGEVPVSEEGCLPLPPAQRPGGDLEAVPLPVSAIRFDYWWTVNRLFNDAFMQPMAAWCEAHDLLFTGHLMEHEWPSPRSQASAMASLRWMQAPGADLLGFQYTPTTPEENGLYLLNLIELRSVKRQLGREWMLVESCGGGGYDKAFEIFKPLEDLLLAYGFNVIDPHLSHQTLAGMRKYDWPQTLSDHSPWWDHYRHHADHVARTNAALSQGANGAASGGHERGRNEPDSRRARILVLHPTTTGWLHYTAPVFQAFAGTGTEAMDALQQSQIDLLLALSAGQIDLDLGDEFILEELARIENHQLIITPPDPPAFANPYAAVCYDAVVLPPAMETWTASTLALMTAYLEAGGHLYTLPNPSGNAAPNPQGSLNPQGPPALIDGRPSDAPARLQARFPDQWHIFDTLDALVTALREAVPPEVAAPDGSALPAGLQWRRVDLSEGRCLYFFCNPWAEAIETEVRLEDRSVQYLDTSTGEIALLPTRSDGDTLIASLSLPPRGHVLWLTTPKPAPTGRIAQTVPAVATTPSAVAPSPVPLTLTTVERRSPNLLMLDYCDVEAPGEALRCIHHMHADDAVWRRQGFDGNPWGRSHQYRRTLIDRPTDPESTSRISYRFHVDPALPQAARDSLQIGVERPWLYTATLNGRPLSVADAPRWFDEEARALAIGPHVHTGENTLALEAKPFHILCEIMPVYLIGDFAAVPAARGFTVTASQDLALGDWTQQGLPVYPGKLRYTFTLDLASPIASAQLEVASWEGSIIVAHLDGGEVGLVVHPPYTLTLHDMAAGPHTLALDVTGNMRNMMGPHHVDGLPGAWTWNRSPHHQPPGAAYKTCPSGLLALPKLHAI